MNKSRKIQTKNNLYKKRKNTMTQKRKVHNKLNKKRRNIKGKIINIKPKRKYLGGAMVAQGTYGCIFRPPLRCENEDTISENTVSKFMNYSEALDEVNENKMIDTIDPKFEFHLKTPRICKLHEDINIDDEENFENCDLAKKYSDLYKNRNMFVLLQLEDGGISLGEYLKNLRTKKSFNDSFKKEQYIPLDKKEKIENEELNKLLISMRPLIKGLKVMSENNIQHLDIKPDNIVIRKNEKDGSYKVRFIDFGLSSKFENIYTKKFLFKSHYFVEPYDSVFLLDNWYNLLTQEKREEIEKYFNSNFYTKNYGDKLIGDNTTFSFDNHPYLSLFQKENYDKLIKKKYFEKKSKDDFQLEIFKKIDVFSLGLIFFFIWNKFIGVFEVERKYENPIHESLKNLMLKMLKSSFIDRISADNLLQEYDNLISIIQYQENVDRIGKKQNKNDDIMTIQVKKSTLKKTRDFLTRKNKKQNNRKSINGGLKKKNKNNKKTRKQKIERNINE